MHQVQGNYNFTYQFHLVGTKSWSQNAPSFPPLIVSSAGDEVMNLSINSGKEKASLTLHALKISQGSAIRD